MSKQLQQTRPLFVSCLCSVLVHLVLAQGAGLLGRYDFGPAVAQPVAVTVELADPSPAAMPAIPAAETAAPPAAARPAATADDGVADRSTDTAAATPGIPSAIPDPSEPLPPFASSAASAPPPLCEGGAGGNSPAVTGSALPAPSSATGEPATAGSSPGADRNEVADARYPASATSATAAPATAPVGADQAAASGPQAPNSHFATHVPPSSELQSVSDFLSSRYEKLRYQITMHGVPIGNAELESKSDQGITSITLRVRSNAAFSGIYPVEDLVETQHVGGLYIMTRISQREGSFTSEENFTINLRKKRVSWFDLKRPRSVTMTVPSDNVLDTLSGIYCLRNRPLQVGRTETLYIYDSESYGEVPVEILRREKMSLPNFSKVNTLVVRPLQKTAGIFRRTGDLQIWLTDDAWRVPVKIETAIALGTVTARLVSAESKPYAASTTAKAERDLQPVQRVPSVN